jgi:hypothetical protein
MLMDLGTGKTKGNAAAAIFYSKNAAPAHYKDKREIENNYQGTVYVIDTGIGAKKKAVETKGVETKPQLTPPDNNSSDIVEADFTELHQDKDDPEDLL